MTEKNDQAPRNFCQKPSEDYLILLEEFDDDPRVTAGIISLTDQLLGRGRGGAVDERNADAPAIPTQKEVRQTLDLLLA